MNISFALASVLSALFVLVLCGDLSAGKKGPPPSQETMQIEQKPGQPLYLPAGEYKQHPSDLAPETDPQWESYQQDRQKRIEEGKQVEDPYEYSPTVIREETVRYEVVDDKKKKKSRPTRVED